MNSFFRYFLNFSIAIIANLLFLISESITRSRYVFVSLRLFYTKKKIYILPFSNNKFEHYCDDNYSLINISMIFVDYLYYNFLYLIYRVLASKEQFKVIKRNYAINVNCPFISRYEKVKNMLRLKKVTLITFNFNLLKKIRFFEQTGFRTVKMTYNNMFYNLLFLFKRNRFKILLKLARLLRKPKGLKNNLYLNEFYSKISLTQKMLLLNKIEANEYEYCVLFKHYYEKLTEQQLRIIYQKIYKNNYYLMEINGEEMTVQQAYSNHPIWKNEAATIITIINEKG